ncbi:hypothetical protein D3C76_1637050 [compost metagenome]
MLSHMRRKKPPSSTALRAIRSEVRITLSSIFTSTLPITWPCWIGAISCGSSTMLACSFFSWPRGTVMVRSSARPAFTSDSAPFHTRLLVSSVPFL